MVGTICHLEIPVRHIGDAVAFYNKLFGWEFDQQSIPNYGLSTNLDVSIGLSKTDGAEDPQRHFYVEVDNIQEVLDKVEKFGGAIESPRYSLPNGIGLGEKFVDPFGNIIGLFTTS